MAKSGDKDYAAEKAGYAFPVQSGARLLRNPDVAEDIRRRARQTLQTKGAEVGVRVLLELAEDVKQKGSVRGTAAKALVQLSGIAGAASLSEQDLAELPADKIRALLHEAERALAARMAAAKTIEHEPAAPVADQVDTAEPGIFD